MSTTDSTPAATPIPIQMPMGANFVQVNGAWDDQNTPVVYSLHANPPQKMALVLQDAPVASCEVTSPSGHKAGGMNGLAYFQQVPEAGEYLITLSRSQMNQGGPYTLAVVLGQLDT
jgi:hypothetical protein